MPLTINGKIFMNLQEAVAWLLANNALPFQSTASFAPDTEIAKSTIINPSPAEIKIGSLVLFADGKVGTVSAITSNGFKVGQDATDLADGVPHIIAINLNASQHLIFTMSEGDPIDAGLVKEISNFSIDASQHLIANYNDGTTQDLGAIFQGNVNISGNFTADSIIENMSGYEFVPDNLASAKITLSYVGVVKNGNKLTLAVAGLFSPESGDTISDNFNLGNFIIPTAVADNLVPLKYTTLGYKKVLLGHNSSDIIEAIIGAFKQSANTIRLTCYKLGSSGYNNDSIYAFRHEETYLLGTNLAS